MAYRQTEEEMAMPGTELAWGVQEDSVNQTAEEEAGTDGELVNPAPDADVAEYGDADTVQELDEELVPVRPPYVPPPAPPRPPYVPPPPPPRAQYSQPQVLHGTRLAKRPCAGAPPFNPSSVPARGQTSVQRSVSPHAQSQPLTGPPRVPAAAAVPKSSAAMSAPPPPVRPPIPSAQHASTTEPSTVEVPLALLELLARHRAELDNAVAQCPPAVRAMFTTRLGQGPTLNHGG